ncbi:MAG: hypothetical protein ACK40O_13420 [Allosphingosinicella sp.]
MKRIVALAALGLAAACTAEGIEPTASEEAALAGELSGMVAGETRACVPSRDLRGNRSVGGAIVFEGPGDTIYVNRPDAACTGIRHGRAISTRTTSSQLCRGDIVTIFDPVSGAQFGGCGLGDFTTYRPRGS